MKVTKCLTHLGGGRLEIDFESEEGDPYSDMVGVIRWMYWYVGDVYRPKRNLRMWIRTEDSPAAIAKLNGVVSVADLEVIKQSLENARKTIKSDCEKLKEADKKVRGVISGIDLLEEVVSGIDLDIIGHSLENARDIIEFERTKLKEMDNKLKDAIGQIEVMV